MVNNSGWQNVKLGEILPEDAAGPLADVINDMKEGNHIDAREARARLLEVLEPHREYLREKGVLVEYLAYYLEYAVLSNLI